MIRAPCSSAAAARLSGSSMYERYALPDQNAVEREFMPTQVWWKFARRFNVAAEQYVPAMRLHAGQTEAAMMRWGLIPSWAEGKPPEQPALVH